MSAEGGWELVEVGVLPPQTFLVDLIFSLQHLPEVVLPSVTRSRREARKLHFIAKEDDEEEEEEDDV